MPRRSLRDEPRDTSRGTSVRGGAGVQTVEHNTWPSSATMPIRVIVVDDQLLLREGIATLLAADARIEVVGRGGNGQEAIDLSGTLQPDVVLMDIRMPVLDGIQAIREIKARWPHVRV